MSKSILFSLPFELVTSVLEMLNYVDLPRLESATTMLLYCTNHTDLIIQLNRLPSVNGVDFDVELEWFVKRGIQIDNIQVDSQDLVKICTNQRHCQALQSRNVDLVVNLQKFDVDQDFDAAMQSFICQKMNLTFSGC